MSSDEISDGTLFTVGRTIATLKSLATQVPSLDESTILPYGDLALNNSFHVARLEGGRLTYLEDWERVFVDNDVDLDTRVGAFTLANYPMPVPRPEDVPEHRPVVFMWNESDEVWEVVDIEATQGETRYLRLYYVTDIIDPEAVLRVAVLLDQRRVRTTEYHYGPDGALTRRVTRERANNFEAVEERFPAAQPRP